jgi:hypothetical protein
MRVTVGGMPLSVRCSIFNAKRPFGIASVLVAIEGVVSEVSILRNREETENLVLKSRLSSDMGKTEKFGNCQPSKL